MKTMIAMKPMHWLLSGVIAVTLIVVSGDRAIHRFEQQLQNGSANINHIWQIPAGVVGLSFLGIAAIANKRQPRKTLKQLTNSERDELIIRLDEERTASEKR